MNTKIVLLCLALVAIASAQAPPPPAGWQPSGRLLLVPARHQDLSPSQSTESEKEAERLLDSGEYYVLLEDGRLQMVRYTAAALQQDKPQQQQQPQQPQPFHYVQVQQQNAAPTAPTAPAGYRSPFPAGTSAFQKQQNAAPIQPVPAKYQNTADAEVSGFEAKVEYHDVKPITAPVFAYNPEPLVRILKK